MPLGKPALPNNYMHVCIVKDLQKILNKDELNMIQIMLGTELMVQVGKSRSSAFKTDTSTPQGDCCNKKSYST